MTWETITAPPGVVAPRPMTVRAQSIPARHYFPDHSHRWNQVVYAISGVLTVTAEAHSFVISPEQAVWLPTGVRHRVGSLLGAEFRSLWIAHEAGHGLPESPTVFGVSPLLQALIVEAADIEGQEDQDGYANRVTILILDQLRRTSPLPSALPWPRGGPLSGLCEALYTEPADSRGPEAWGRELGMSGRTLARRFETEVGMSLRSWRRRLRMFKAIELLGGGLGVTQTAMEIGYGSTSAFVYAFRTEIGSSPQAYMRGRAVSRDTCAAAHVGEIEMIEITRASPT
ncbi:AraC family transcriptional regulator [Methylobacterium oxalidis]|uniref:AraC family transcriptional regulator n=1 Tax=Methylobacterium oxalidis TaxID=944322 RepID=A0A512J868_9HYPH|nr:helix-turn-helix transcriptional regulator [Methylobacterium oxalidis]GEP06154.1 AraC family transcriptional regulator [Methylobacterium oxalidis]GJE34582.1 HTH-type transcriptional regulator NimR [Methylobacterium oxalidis]GLS65173.1 AraC family transcriptional regulator [Methylobacterium oxalidis]